MQTKANARCCFSEGSSGAAPLPRQPVHSICLLLGYVQDEQEGSGEEMVGVEHTMPGPPGSQHSTSANAVCLVRVLLVAQAAYCLNEERWRDKNKTLFLTSGRNFSSICFYFCPLLICSSN